MSSDLPSSCESRANDQAIEIADDFIFRMAEQGDVPAVHPAEFAGRHPEIYLALTIPGHLCR
jgi:hypothetical protein